MTDQTKNKEGTVSDQIESMYHDVWQMGVQKFSDFENIDRSGDAMEDLASLLSVAQMMVYNILDFSPAKLDTARQMVGELNDMCNALLDEYQGNAVDESTKERHTSLIDKARSFIAKLKEAKAKESAAMPDESEDCPDSEKGCGGGGGGGCKKPKKRMMRKESSLFITKDDSGRYRWIASYSNNFRDDDHPAEIISKESHMRFVEMVDKGEADFPELWHWHIPGSAWGKADVVWFDEETGVAMASGYVYEGHEKEAEALMDLEIPIGVSHGMPKSSLVYDQKDSTIITSHITKEISDLPLAAAANKLTGIYVITKETNMALSEPKKEYLKSVGIDDETLAQIDAANKEKTELAKAEGIETKEESAPVADPEVPAADANKEAESVTVQFVTGDQLADAVKQMSDAFASAIRDLKEEITQVKEMKSKEETPSTVPTASIAAIIAQSMSATKSKETLVRKNDALANSAPEYAPANDTPKSVVQTGNPIFDQALTSILTGK